MAGLLRVPAPAAALLVALAAVGPALAPGTARAQESPDSIRTDTITPFRHPGLVVSVLRTRVPLATAPYSVSVVSAPVVPTQDLGLADRVRAVPGLQVDNRYNPSEGDRIVIRGFGARAQFGVRGVQVLVDGIPATMPDGQATLNHLDLAALDRVEVLRGPAAAVYGNAAGGVILLETRGPPTTGLGGSVSVLTGGDGLVRTSATAGGEVGAGAFDATVSRRRMGGFRAHSSASSTNLTGRVEVPAAGGWLRFTTHGAAYRAENPGGLTLEQYREQPDQAQPYNVAQQTGETGHHGQLGVRWERQLGDLALTATGYGVRRSIENPIPPAVIDLSRWAAGGRVTLHTQGSLDDDTSGPWLRRLAWTAGLEVASQWDHRQNHENLGGTAGALTLDQSERVTSTAAFAQLAVPLTAWWRTFLALRYDRFRFTANDHFTTGDANDSGQRTMAAISPTAGVAVTPAGGWTVYANVATAFQTPTTTELVNRPDGAGGFNPELEPQRAVTGEVGTRLRVGDVARFEIAGYETRLRNALIGFEVPSAPGRQYFRNAGRARYRGVEAALGLTLAGFAVDAAWTRIDARFTDYQTAEASYDGRRIPGIRPWSVDAGVARQLGSAVRLRVDQRWVGAMAADDANETVASGFALTDLAAALTELRVGGSVARPYLGIRNVFDRTYVSSVVVNAFGGRFFEPGPGRTLYGGVEVRFGGAR